MKHNVIRAKAISAIFQLQRFTVRQLAEVSGLRPNQLYPILKECKDKHLLSTESESTVKREAHRPILFYSLTSEAENLAPEELLPLVPISRGDESVYQMTSNLELRSSMADELRPLMHVSKEEARTRAESESFRTIMNRAAALLDEVELQLGFFDNTLRLPSDHNVFLALDSKMAETQEELEVATYESGIQLSDLNETELESNAVQEEPWYSLKVAWVRFRNYGKRASDLKQTYEATLADLGAQREYASVLSALNFKNATPETIERRLGDWYREASNSSLREIFSTTLENLRETLQSGGSGPSSSSSWMVVHSLMASAIRYCSDAKLPLKMATYLLEQQHDDRCLIYNIANLRVLAEESEEAFTVWSRWADEFLKSGYLWQSIKTEGRYRSPYSYVALISIPVAGLSASVFSELEVKLGELTTFSVASLRPLTTRGLRPYVAEPTLCDPLGCVQEIRVSESLGNQIGRLYVYGSLEKRVQNVPGMPVVRLATGLVMSGVASSRAWEIAHSLHVEQALLVLHSFDERSAAVGHVDDAVQELQRQCGGMLLGAVPTKHTAPAALAKSVGR